MSELPSISVLVSTYNRSAVLAETLRSFRQLERGGIAVDWIIIDNNSRDATRTVVQQSEGDLPARYLFEPRPGKNCALNKAITECRLGDIVVFTDDDITPQRDWLLQITEACSNYPNYSVFGGRIIPSWPAGVAPFWAQDQFLQTFAFALHDHGSEPKEYAPDTCPFGANFWIRKEILSGGYRYNEAIGPRPKNRIMGSESAFLMTLRKAGYNILYYPAARVEHRVQQTECSRRSLRRRAVRLGRGEIYLSGLPRPGLRRVSPLGWRAYAVAKVFYASAYWMAALVCSAGLRRARHEVAALSVLGNALECLRVGGMPDSVDSLSGGPRNA